MSKSHGRYLTVGMCYGNNTPYYRARRKHWRRVNRNRIRDVFARYEGEDIDDNYKPFIIPTKNLWDEPTDGHWKNYPKELKKKLNWIGYKGVYLTKDGKKVKR